MPSHHPWSTDPWLRGCAVAGAVMAGVTAITGLPWALWLGWAYVVLLSVVDVRRRSGSVSDT